MQILPGILDKAKDVLGAARLPMRDDKGFARALNQSIQDVRHNRADAADAPGDAAADDDAAVEQALLAGLPYNPTPELFSPFAPQVVRLTAQEADTLAEAMRDDGVPAKALAALRDAGRLPGGATADQLIQAAREALEGKTPVLSREEKAQLQSLSHKAAGSAGKDVNNLFAEGTPQSALAALMAGLAESPASTAITSEEMAALTKALRLPQGTARSLLDAFHGEPSLTLSGREWNDLLSTAKAQTDMVASDMDKLLTSLEKRLTPILRDASKREEMERLAGLREDKAVSQARTLIKDRATVAAPGREDAVDPDSQTRAAPRRDNAARVQAGDKADIRTERDTTDSRTPARPAAEHAVADRATEKETLDGDLAGERDSTPRDETPPRHADGRSGIRPTEHSDERPAATSATLYATVNRGVDTVVPQTMQPDQTADGSGRAPLPARTLEQIEQAVLTAGKNGVQRLEVALTPEDLGSMTVVLTTRHGEVSALIQPERAETAALIAEQVEHIKAQLENQGFKVEKVDVQPQLADQQGQDWQGADQHNASRDLAARVEHMERLRRLGRSASASSSEALSTLARDMHLQARQATLAGHGLHIIA